MARCPLGAHLLVLVLVLVVAACSGGDDHVSSPDAGLPDGSTCLQWPDGGACLDTSLTLQAIDFETQAAPAAAVVADINGAWNIPSVFPLGCAPLATLQLDPGNGFVGHADVCVPSFVVGAIVAGSGTIGLSINDKRQQAMIGSEVMPYPIYVLAAATLQSWLDAFSGIDRTRFGLVAVTFRDAAGQPLAGVTPQLTAVGASPPMLVLATDRRTLQAAAVTTSSGTIVLALEVGHQVAVTGSASGRTFEKLNVATLPGGIFFEQVDAK